MLAIYKVSVNILEGSRDSQTDGSTMGSRDRLINGSTMGSRGRLFNGSTMCN